jgi:peptidoglycan/LPS O-acetylase OafA/YrhL
MPALSVATPEGARSRSAGDDRQLARYRPELDGLRALAVLLVVQMHSGSPIGPAYLGVDVFFVLSGYLISGLLAAEYRAVGTVDFVAFFTRRALRLVPALIVTLPLVATVAALDHRQAAGATAVEMLAAVTYTMDFVAAGHIGAWLPHTWSLAVEEQFYLVWPFALLAILRSGHAIRRLVAIVLGLALVAPAAAAALGGQVVHYTPLGAGFQLTAGALLALLPVRSVPRWSWIGIVLGYLLVWRVSLVETGVAIVCGPLQLFTLATMVLILWALQHSPRPLTHAAVVWIGRRSYGLYLFHLPILYFVMARGLPRLPAFVLGVGLSLAAAAASYRYVEAPFLRLKPRRQLAGAAPHGSR